MSSNSGGNLRYSNTGQTLRLDDVEVMNGVADFGGGSGGGIQASGLVVIENGSSIHDNQAGGTALDSASRGGGIHLNGNSTLTVTNSSISSNDGAQPRDGGRRLGGGIAADVSGATALVVTLTNATIDSNRAGGGPAGNEGGSGGGISIGNGPDGATLTATGGSISGNKAGGGLSNSSGGGGGVDFKPNAFVGGTISLTGVTVNNNSAGADGGTGQGLGGGISTNADLDSRPGTSVSQNTVGDGAPAAASTSVTSSPSIPM